MALVGGSRALEAAQAVLAREANPACLLDERGVIRFVNEAWDRFARANGGEPGALGASVVGTRWLDHVAGDDVRAHHARLLDRALQGQGWSGVVHLGECNSPTEARLLAARFERVLEGPGGGPVGIAAVYTTLAARPMFRVHLPVEADEAAYRRADGLILQCSCCRRVRRPTEEVRWDLAPELVATTADRVSHGLCDLCLHLYYHL